MTNFYGVATARRRYAEGDFPEQYLFGAVALEAAGHQVVYAQPPESRGRRVLDALSRRARGHLGDLSSQLSALRRRGGDGVVFGAADETLTALALLRSLGLLRTPVVAVFHHPPRTSLLFPRVARGYDVVFTLSSAARDALIGLGRTPESTIAISWGPQLDWAPYGSSPRAEEFVMSCGKSARDIDTLAAAVAPTEVSALLYAPQGWTAPPTDGRVQVQHFPEMPPYLTVMEQMARASVVAVPLQSTEKMYGLSEINDALAIGKPIVMTRTPLVDLDLEEIGCGHRVDPGDVDGWRSVLVRLHDQPELRREMGRRAREFAEREWNADVCGGQIVDGLTTLLRESR